MKALKFGLKRDSLYEIKNGWNGSDNLGSITGSYTIKFPCRVSSKISDTSFTAVRTGGSDASPEFGYILLGDDAGGRLDKSLEGSARALTKGIPGLKKGAIFCSLFIDKMGGFL